jgi:hypothetical protein
MMALSAVNSQLHSTKEAALSNIDIGAVFGRICSNCQRQTAFGGSLMPNPGRLQEMVFSPSSDSCSAR